jgi:hypothetical protein
LKHQSERRIRIEIPKVLDVGAIITTITCIPSGIIGMIIGANAGSKEKFVINKSIDNNQKKDH